MMHTIDDCTEIDDCDTTYIHAYACYEWSDAWMDECVCASDAVLCMGMHEQMCMCACCECVTEHAVFMLLAVSGHPLPPSRLPSLSSSLSILLASRPSSDTPRSASFTLAPHHYVCMDIGTTCVCILTYTYAHILCIS